MFCLQNKILNIIKLIRFIREIRGQNIIVRFVVKIIVKFVVKKIVKFEVKMVGFRRFPWVGVTSLC